MGWASSGRGLATALPLIILLFFAVALGACASPGGRRSGRGRAVTEGYYLQDDPLSAAARRRELVGPGSSPPTCRGRCGGCRPCRPVHVAIQPGRSFLLEYYPEAWRCKCGDRLYMP